MKKQQGITLIALVITIIVLLILAGVSISMVIGNNGILNQASTAKVNTENASEQEKVELALLSAKMLTYRNGGEVDETAINKQLNEAGVNATATTKDGKLVVTFNDTKAEYEVTGEIVTKVENPETGNTATTLVSQITSANYGDKVAYTANGVSDWKIFYKDGTNVYIIASDYLAHGGSSDITKIVSGTGMTKTGIYRTYWSSAPSTADTTNHLAKFSPETAETKTWSGNYSTNSNGRCVSTLLDTTLWSAYASGVGGESAIGSPTLNMFVASWNEKYPNDSDKIYCNNDSATGYYVGTTTNPTSTYIDSSIMKQKEGYNNTLYYPYQSAVDSGICYGYWLASPSESDTINVMCVNCNGYVGSIGYDVTRYTCCGVRPVVSLSSSIKGTSTTTDGVTTWTLSN